uniref:Uncharacterized protein n=1 Tax=Ditylenchus dipsaci TaxID=166011 RepID=A0A915E403_9BILA
MRLASKLVRMLASLQARLSRLIKSALGNSSSSLYPCFLSLNICEPSGVRRECVVSSESARLDSPRTSNLSYRARAEYSIISKWKFSTDSARNTEIDLMADFATQLHDDPDNYVNDANVEVAWAMKAAESASIHMNLLIALEILRKTLLENKAYSEEFAINASEEQLHKLDEDIFKTTRLLNEQKSRVNQERLKISSLAEKWSKMGDGCTSVSQT